MRYFVLHELDDPCNVDSEVRDVVISENAIHFAREWRFGKDESLVIATEIQIEKYTFVVKEKFEEVKRMLTE